MNCRRAQSDIALWAGDDLDEAGLLSLRRHLEACPECRCYMQEMQLLMRLIDECPLREEGDEASKEAVEDSLWPSLSTRLVTLSSRRSDHFNGWIPAVSVAAVCLAMTFSACTSVESKQAAFLEAAQDQASQEDIRRQWGEPTNSRSLDGGQSLWTYEKRGQQSGNRYAAPGIWCEQYALTFDERGILRHWTKQSYFHGGELMPRQCIPQ